MASNQSASNESPPATRMRSTCALVFLTHEVDLFKRRADSAPLILAFNNLINSKAISNITLPVAAGAAVYVGYKIGHAAFGWTEDLFDNIKKNMKTAKEKRDEKLTRDSFENPFNNDGFADDGTPTNIFGLPGWGIWPGVL
jgi:hypothetical protein